MDFGRHIQYSIGQGGLRQSPLQMANMVARIATNRQIFQPTLLYSKNSSLPPSPDLDIDKDFSGKLSQECKKATELGTARCRIEGIRIAEKPEQDNGEITI